MEVERVPIESFKYEAGSPKKFKQENGVMRECCENCGAYTCEYELAKHLYCHGAIHLMFRSSVYH